MNKKLKIEPKIRKDKNGNPKEVFLNANELKYLFKEIEDLEKKIEKLKKKQK